jgi:hypothetical protein
MAKMPLRYRFGTAIMGFTFGSSFFRELVLSSYATSHPTTPDAASGLIYTLRVKGYTAVYLTAAEITGIQLLEWAFPLGMAMLIVAIRQDFVNPKAYVAAPSLTALGVAIFCGSFALSFLFFRFAGPVIAQFAVDLGIVLSSEGTWR